MNTLKREQFTARRRGDRSMLAEANGEAAEIKIGKWWTLLSPEDARALGTFLLESVACEHCAKPLDDGSATCEECKDLE